MPTKGTARRSIRIEDALWRAAQTTAQARGDNLSNIIRAALEQYVKEQEEPSGDH